MKTTKKYVIVLYVDTFTFYYLYYGLDEIWNVN